MFISKSKLNRILEELEELKEWRKSLIICEKSKLLMRKEDAKEVTIQRESSVSLYHYYDGVEHKYYSPVFAPKYDYVDEREEPPKKFKTIKEHRVEVKNA